MYLMKKDSITAAPYANLLKGMLCAYWDGA